MKTWLLRLPLLPKFCESLWKLWNRVLQLVTSALWEKYLLAGSQMLCKVQRWKTLQLRYCMAAINTLSIHHINALVCITAKYVHTWTWLVHLRSAEAWSCDSKISCGMLSIPGTKQGWGTGCKRDNRCKQRTASRHEGRCCWAFWTRCGVMVHAMAKLVRGCGSGTTALCLALINLAMLTDACTCLSKWRMVQTCLCPLYCVVLLTMVKCKSPDSYIFLLMQVARHRQACVTDFTEALATYLLSFAADMRQKDVDKAVLTSPSTTSESGLATPAASVQPQCPLIQDPAAASMPLWTCFLAADASMIVKQVHITFCLNFLYLTSMHCLSVCVYLLQ